MGFQPARKPAGGLGHCHYSIDRKKPLQAPEAALRLRHAVTPPHVPFVAATRPCIVWPPTRPFPKGVALAPFGSIQGSSTKRASGSQQQGPQLYEELAGEVHQGGGSATHREIRPAARTLARTAVRRGTAIP